MNHPIVHNDAFPIRDATEIRIIIPIEAQSEQAGMVGALNRLVSGLGEMMTGVMRHLDILNHPQELLAVLGRLHLTAAILLLGIGVLCILNGYRWHRMVIMCCALLCGVGLGWLLSRHLSEAYIIAASLGIVCAAIVPPLLRYAVMGFAGLTGAFLGANIWTAAGYPPDAHLAGAAMGFILFGMCSFIMYRLVIVLFTSFSGAALVLFGMITVLLNVPNLAEHVRHGLTEYHMLLPGLLLSAAMIGLYAQHRRLRTAAVHGRV